MIADPLSPAELDEFRWRAASFPAESLLLRRFLATIDDLMQRIDHEMCGRTCGDEEQEQVRMRGWAR